MDAKIAAVTRLGEARISSPIHSRDADPQHPSVFVRESEYVPLHITVDMERERPGNVLFEKAGPREKLYLNPSTTRAAVVTCGGLCPGLNNVIRSLVQSLHYAYGIQGVLGIRYGYRGMNAAHGLAPMELDPEMVSDIHEIGGTILGTSRGPEDPKVMLEFLKSHGVGILFPVGGDGTQRGALAIQDEAQRQGYPLAVVGVPKTIDNDIQYVARTFGYTTSVDSARGIIDVAHTEARAVINGVGLVKLMGRDSGFIAAGAALASGEVNYCLIPEQDFELDGDLGLLAVLQRRLQRKQHAVIVVAEGAGQHLMPKNDSDIDASGNIRKADIGTFLKERIGAHFKQAGLPINVRYIDPSYAIRGLPANTEDAVLCDMLARNAAHAGMAGCTGLIIGLLHNRMIHVPTAMATDGRKKVELNGVLWKAVLAGTGQPALWK